MRKSQRNTDENNLLFALWLCSKGIVDAKTAYNAYLYRQTHKPALDEIAVFKGKVSVQQSIEIQSLQSMTNVSYGEAAVKLGYLTADDLKALTLIQINSAPTLIESLSPISEVDREYLEKAQDCFLEMGLGSSWDSPGLSESRISTGKSNVAQPQR